MDLEKETQLSKPMLSVYSMIYGLKTIPVLEQGDLQSFITIPLKKLLDYCHDKTKIKYLIFVHTTAILHPFGYSLLTILKEKYKLNSAILFEMTMQKCASYFKALEILTVLLKNNPDYYAIVITGEVAFTPLLRVVPGSSIVGDAATASLLSCDGFDNQMLSISNHLMSGYAKGIYLSDSEIKTFDSKFIQSMLEIICDALNKAKITLDKINLILPHNVNLPTWRKIAIALNFSIEKIYLDNIPKYGHTFCSDHIINLHSALLENRLKKGDYYLMTGCGMGFYLAAAVFIY